MEEDKRREKKYGCFKEGVVNNVIYFWGEKPKKLGTERSLDLLIKEVTNDLNENSLSGIVSIEDGLQ